MIFCLFRLLNMNWFRKQNLIEYCLLFFNEFAVARLGCSIQYISYNAYGEFDDPGNR